MTIAEGTRLGRYEIRSKIGAGGMGEVYRARDEKLNRDVAIKVLPDTLSQNADRLRRFEQEAQAAGALNHPNILAVYDVGTHDGAPYVVSELLEGESLKERLSDGPLAQRKTIDYAIQVAHGLTAAHEKGIVHRDLKPDNLFITKDDRVKILDFGIAKLREPANQNIAQTDIATRKVHTDPGTVTGTVGYMSPEQVRGRPVDHRADIFSFGAVLYEMLCGRRAFHGDSAVETLNAILKEEPPELTTTNRNIAPALERVVWHCLEKSPDRRFQSATDVAFALESLSGSSGVSGQTMTAMTSPSSRERIRKYSPWIIAGLFALAFLVALPFALLYLRRPSSQAPATVRFLIPPPEKAEYLGDAAISPDGRLIVFGVRDASGKESLWLRQLDSLEAHPLAGTELGGQTFWSPDSRSICFIAVGKLKRIDVSGGPAQTLSDAGVSAGGTWNRDGVIVFVRNLSDGLYSIPATGGTPTRVTTLDRSRNEILHVWPYFLPDGRHFLYLARSSQEEKSAIFVGSLDSKETKFLLNADSSMAYAPPGFLLFARQQTLMAQGFNADKLQLTGDEIPVAQGIGIARIVANARSLFSVSDTGVLVYRSQSREDSQLVWFDRAGRQLGTVGPLGVFAAIRLSPDEKRIALQRLDDEKGTYDIWLIELSRGTPTRLTFDPANDIYPIWSPDGSRIVFGSNRDGTVNLYQKLSSGAGNDELLFKSDHSKPPNDWSPDGRYLLYQDSSQKDFDLWVLPLFEERKPELFLQTDYAENYGRFSPDGHWITYVSNESGKREVYVRSFPAAGGKWQISNGGGFQPHWRRDGKELFYLTSDKKLMAVEVNGSSGTFEAGIPRALFDLRINSTNGFSDFDVTADGQHFLVNTLVEQNARSPVTVVMNWTADLKR
jgi:eukaryotic-like serine/threonine-protein kinase